MICRPQSGTFLVRRCVKAPDELSFSSVYTLFANKQLLFTVAKNHKATLFIKISVYFPFLFTLVNTQVHNLFEASRDRWFNSGLYMIGYGTRKIILKSPPFWIMNEELQEREIQKRFCFHLMFWIFPLLIFLVQLAERREFPNNLSCSVHYHI